MCLCPSCFGGWGSNFQLDSIELKEMTLKLDLDSCSFSCCAPTFILNVHMLHIFPSKSDVSHVLNLSRKCQDII